MTKTNLIIILSSIILLIFVLELLRRRRLREEYSWLWLMTSLIYLLIAIWPMPSIWIAEFIGASSPAITFAFLGINFIILILIQFSVRLSRLTTQVKNITQEVTILDYEIKKTSEELAEYIEKDENADFGKPAEGYKLYMDRVEALQKEIHELRANLIGGGE